MIKISGWKSHSEFIHTCGKVVYGLVSRDPWFYRGDICKHCGEGLARIWWVFRGDHYEFNGVEKRSIRRWISKVVLWKIWTWGKGYWEYKKD